MGPLKLLDLYCGAGGAAVGYHQARFEVMGVDNRPQKHYPFAFYQADALEFLAAGGWQGFDAIHASPPCQYYTRLRHLPWLKDRIYWRSIPPTREALLATGLPYIIENVEDAGWDMEDSTVVCGQDLGLSLYRHRRFETSGFLMLRYPHQAHGKIIAAGRSSLGKRHHGQGGTWGDINGWNGNAGLMAGIERRRSNMGIDWMTGDELSQAIPPAYTRFVGQALRAYLEAQR